MDDKDLAEVKFDKNGEFVRTEDNMWATISFLMKALDGTQEQVFELIEITKKESEAIGHIARIFGMPEDK